MIKKEEIKNMARLIRIALEEEEVVSFKEALSFYLDYFQRLNKVDTSKVKPFISPSLLKNVMRGDEVKVFPQRKKLLALMPKRKGNYLKVKSIL